MFKESLIIISKYIDDLPVGYQLHLRYQFQDPSSLTMEVALFADVEVRVSTRTDERNEEIKIKIKDVKVDVEFKVRIRGEKKRSFLRK